MRPRGTPLEDAVASEYGEGVRLGGFLVFPSQMRGFVQTGAPAEAHRVVDFGTYRKKCPRPVLEWTFPGRLVPRRQRTLFPCCGGPMEGNGTVTTTLRHVPIGSVRTKLNRFRPKSTRTTR